MACHAGVLAAGAGELGTIVAAEMTVAAMSLENRERPMCQVSGMRSLAETDPRCGRAAPGGGRSPPRCKRRLFARFAGEVRRTCGPTRADCRCRHSGPRGGRCARIRQLGRRQATVEIA